MTLSFTLYCSIKRPLLVQTAMQGSYRVKKQQLSHEKKWMNSVYYFHGFYCLFYSTYLWADLEKSSWKNDASQWRDSGHFHTRSSFALLWIIRWVCKPVAVSCGLVSLHTEKTPSEPKCVTTKPREKIRSTYWPEKTNVNTGRRGCFLD